MANAVTMIRIICSIALLWVPVFSPAFYALYLLAGISDILDGAAARRTGTVSEFGSKLDTVADFVLVVVCLFKLIPVLHIPALLSIWIMGIAVVNLPVHNAKHLGGEVHSDWESRFLEEKAKSPNEAELIAIVEGRTAGTAGIMAAGKRYKVRHRAEFGISLRKEYWGLGLGKALTAACIQCAREAGYDQLELNVVAENERALSLYRQLGFVKSDETPEVLNREHPDIRNWFICC